MASTGMAAKKDGTIDRSPRTRAILLTAMQNAGLEAGRWLAGVRYQPRDCSGLIVGTSVWYCVGEDTVPPSTECVPFVEQFAFDIFDGLRDSTLSPLEADGMEELLRRRFTEMVSWAFGKVLTGQVAAFDGLTLPNQAHAPDGVGYTAAAPIATVIAQLENDMANTLHGAEGMIHLSPGMFIKAKGIAGIIEDDAGIFRTPTGSIVVADAGYYRAAPPASQSPSAANQTEWVYASGPIAYEATPFELIGGDDPNSYTQIARNKLHRHAQEWGIMLFDPCSVTAQLASYTS